MSSDTAKENTSVVDSSLTDWKNDLGNLDGPESNNYKANEDGFEIGAEEPRQSCEHLHTSSVEKMGKPSDTRYFIIKSMNHQNIELSIQRGIWATQVMNEPILEEAFHNCGKVILIFSVNMSGFFQGYAQMVSSIGWRRDSVWSQGTGGSNPWGRTFQVKWLRLYDLPFQQTLHLKNPLNEYKPVKISRDCQELPCDIGEALCELLDVNGGDASLERGEMSMGDFSSERSRIDASRSLSVENSVPPMHVAPLFYPSSFYHHQVDPSIFCRGHQISNAGSVGSSCGASDTSMPFVQWWGQSAEISPISSTLTEDDFLEMTYEEYLEAHSRCINKARNSVAHAYSKTKKPSVTRVSSDHEQSGSSAKKRLRQRSPRR